jgi:hypothetical protein
MVAAGAIGVFGLRFLIPLIDVKKLICRAELCRDLEFRSLSFCAFDPLAYYLGSPCVPILERVSTVSALSVHTMYARGYNLTLTC